MNKFKQGIIASLVCLGITGLVQANTNGTVSSPEVVHSNSTQSVQSGVDQAAFDKLNQKRSVIFQEAITAIVETQNALTALSQEKPDIESALKSLEESTGKLAIVLARDPELMFAPIDVAVETHDVLVTPEAVKALIYDANYFLDKGRIQKARLILNNLISEVQIHTTAIPLATYPEATKVAARLIDEGKIEEAKQALEAQLRTLVVSKEVIPLPVLRTSLLLNRIEAMVQKEQRTENENTELSELFLETHAQLEMAKLLDYISDDFYEELSERLDELQEKSADGKSGTGWFDAIKEKMSDLLS